jgi:hypothetical protein
MRYPFRVRRTGGVLSGNKIVAEGKRIDLFDNPVGCRTSLAVSQAKALRNCAF